MNIQNIHLSRGNCDVSALKLLASVFVCRWPGWKMITTRKIEAKLFKLFPRVFKKSILSAVVSFLFAN